MLADDIKKIENGRYVTQDALGSKQRDFRKRDQEIKNKTDWDKVLWECPGCGRKNGNQYLTCPRCKENKPTTDGGEGSGIKGHVTAEKQKEILNIEQNIEHRKRDLESYQQLLKGGTVQKGGVSADRYKGYIYKIREEIKQMKMKISELKRSR